MTTFDQTVADQVQAERERIARCLRTEAHGRNDRAFNEGVLFAARCVLTKYDDHDAHSFCVDPVTCPRCSDVIALREALAERDAEHEGDA